jgi:hypothetical protein
MAEQKYMDNGKKKEKCFRINNRDIEKDNQFKYRDPPLPIMTTFHLQ